MLEDATAALIILRRQFPDVAENVSSDIRPVAGGFSGANVFKVEGSDADYCLRRWPARNFSPRRMLAIHQLLELAGKNGSRVVPMPLKAISGSTLTEVEGTFWQLEPWMPGKADFLQTPTDARLNSAMNHLAGFHNAVRDWTPGVNVRRWFQPASLCESPTIAERIRMITSYEGSVADFDAALDRERIHRFKELGTRITSLFRVARDSVLNDLRTVVDVRVSNQPSIRDLWHDHLLFRDDELSGIVDFGAMATDSVTCDLSRLLGSLFGDDASKWQSAIGHYENVRPLSEAEHRLLRPLDRSSVLLSGMTWLKRRYILRNTPENLSPVCDRLELIVARLTTLAESLR